MAATGWPRRGLSSDHAKPMSRKPLFLGSILLVGAACTYFITHSAKEPAPAHPAREAARHDADSEQHARNAAVKDLLAGLRTLTAADGPVDFQALQEAIQSLVRKDPKAAADFAGNLTNGPVREIALLRVAQAWADRNPEAAAGWANALRNQEERGALLNGIFAEVAQADPAKALQMAETHGMLSFSPGMTGNLVQQWAARDYGAALRWTEAQPSGSPRDEMFLRLAMARCASSPEEAAGMVSERIAPGSIQEEAAITIISRWAATDPEAAREWANTFDPGDFRERALNEITLVTASRAPVEASN